MHARRRARDDTAERSQPQRPRLLARSDQERGRAVVDPGRVPRGDGAVLFERGLELAELFDRAVRTRVLVLADQLLAVVHGLDFAGEEALSLGARITLLATRGVRILFRAADVLLHADVLRRLAQRDRVVAQVDHPRI